MPLSKKLAAEFIGTFWLVLGGCGSAVLAAAYPEVGIGWAGVSLAMSEEGLSVSEVHPGTPAAKAGVKVGDLLVAINGVEYKPENQEKMAKFEKMMVPGQEFTYTIARNGKNKDVQFALAEMPMDVVARMVGMHMLNDHAAVEVASADD